MKKLGTLLTVSALALAATAAPASAKLTTDESTCGDITHSQGASAYVDGQHYVVQVFAFDFGGETGLKVMGKKKGFTGDILNCNIEEDGGTITVILASK